MIQAVRNERLAVRQKLTDAYQQPLDVLSKGVDGLWSARIELIEQETAAKRQPVEMFDLFSGRDIGTSGLKYGDAIIIYDSNGKLVYPAAGDGGYPGELSEEFNEAWGVEFTDEDLSLAIRLYEQIADSPVVDDYTRYSALLGNVRCLRKLGEIEKAVVLCREIAYGKTPESISSSSVALIARARILLVKLKSQTQEGLKRSDLQNLIDSAINYTPGSDYGFLPMPSGTRIFLLRTTLEIVEESQWAEELKPQVFRAKELLSAEELAAAVLDKYYTGAVSQAWSEDDALKLVSLLTAALDTIEGVEWSWGEQLTEEVKRQIFTVLDAYQTRKAGAAAFGRPAFATFESWPEDSLRRLECRQEAFGMYHNFGGKTYLLLQKAKELGSDFDLCGDGIEELGISYRITDNFGAYASGLENPETAAFLKSPLGKFFPSWDVEIHFKDVDIFETTAGRQEIVYMLAGLLAIAVMITAGSLATKVVGRQIRMNKLKNDFIATVSHELKTPLASMRVLVDTLLEGSYRDQHQVTEYLQLVSKENERLTGLIDNFLTFSRMERSKQAFAMVKTSPAAIARDAAEAVKTKFSKGKCKFEVNISEDLPDVLADQDAMVTVLINLLDNAYKYSYDNRQIELRAFSKDGSVCFSVCDKGIGMSRRSARKIFNRFYQADRSLSRGAEGCGLGLSIAKFIIDAHKGTISIDSKPGEGSTFTVRLPAGN
jgi:signal transduction histidine kinase